jgi:hypothetical protein
MVLVIFLVGWIGIRAAVVQEVAEEAGVIVMIETINSSGLLLTIATATADPKSLVTRGVLDPSGMKDKKRLNRMQSRSSSLLLLQ